VVALGDIRGPAGGLGVRRGGGREVAAQLVQVAADGVPAVPLADHVAQAVSRSPAAAPRTWPTTTARPSTAVERDDPTC
jgi:hypothetical protein